MTMQFIAGYTTVSGSPTYFDFTSIPQTFTHLQLRYFSRDTAALTTRGMFMEINGNTVSGNSEHYLKGDGGNATSQGYTGLGRFDWGEIPAASALSNAFGVGIIDILDYTNTNKNKTLRILHGYDLNGSGQVNLWSGLWTSTSAINFIRIYSNTSFANGTTAQLYGITTSELTGA